MMAVIFDTCFMDICKISFLYFKLRYLKVNYWYIAIHISKEIRTMWRYFKTSWVDIQELKF